MVVRGDVELKEVPKETAGAMFSYHSMGRTLRLTSGLSCPVFWLRLCNTPCPAHLPAKLRPLPSAITVAECALPLACPCGPYIHTHCFCPAHLRVKLRVLLSTTTNAECSLPLAYLALPVHSGRSFRRKRRLLVGMARETSVFLCIGRDRSSADNRIVIDPQGEPVIK